uniref:Uncharacterized protein n=1 Tax=Anguilla anguilla TaxID=7936 RepID=A0A0E9QTU9_ANGAN
MFQIRAVAFRTDVLFGFLNAVIFGEQRKGSFIRTFKLMKLLACNAQRGPS